MILKRHFSIYAAILTVISTSSPSEAAYTVNFKPGTFPSDITIKNENGLLPDADGYKRGYTKDGWTIDRYDNRGNVALSPTFTGSEDACRNSMTLPELEINDGDFLQWNALSLHPDRLEHYVVEATGADGTVTLLDVEEEKAEWTGHMVDLSQYAGQKLEISFICVSSNRYMLALDNITVGAPEGLVLNARDLTETYCDAAAAMAGYTDVTVEVTNTGATLTEGEIVLDADYEPAGSATIDFPWKPGETRTFTLQAPVSMNHRTICEVYYTNGENRTLLSEKTLYCSTFKRKLMVDKGTGMWCNNCPKGILDIEKLVREFGSTVIPLDTHVNDLLKNDPYFNELEYRAIPWMMLNRIKTSASGSPELFYNFYYRPVKFDICFTKAETTENEKASVAVSVRCAEETDNASGRFRVGYVVTGDFHQESNSRYYQENSCNMTSNQRFFYLPSVIPTALAYFHHVTLTSEHAFDGFEGSLPSTMVPGENYSFSWDIERPKQLEDMKNGRVVAFVLDTESGEVMNCTEINLLNPDFSGIEDTISDPESNGVALTVKADGKVTVNLSKAADFTLEAWAADGRLATSVSGHASNSTDVTLPIAHGIYILRLKSTCGMKTCKAIL